MEHLPPWLRNVPLPPRPTGRGEAPLPAPADQPASDEIPSWLVELQGEVNDAAADAAPPSLPDQPGAPEERLAPRPEPFADLAWLNDADAAPPPAEPAADQGEQQSTGSRIKMPTGATDWLRSMGHDPDARSEPLSEPINLPEDQSGVPDWLRDLSADEVARGIESDAPDSQPRFDPMVPGWLADDLPGPDASTVSANFRGRGPSDADTPDNLPDWLQGSPEPGAPPPPRPPADQGTDLVGSAEMPAWLRDLGEDAPAAQEPAAEDEPAWLREAVNRPPTDRLAAADEIEVPAWLRDSAEPPPAAPAPMAQAEPAGDDEMPSWLRESAPDAPPPTGGVAAPPSRDAAPAWLDATASPADDDQAPAWLREAETPAPPAPEDDRPAWLNPPAAPPREDEPPAWLGRPAAAADADAAPAWLQEVERPAPPPPADDVPSWLQDAAPPPEPTWLREALADEAAPQPGPSGGEPPPAAPPWLQEEPAPDLTDDVPSWLQEPPPATVTPPPADVPSWLQEESTPPPAEDVPSWLQDGPAPPPTGDVPPWLQEPPARPAPPPAPTPGNLPSWLLSDESPAGETPSSSPTDPGLPSWLRGVADEPPPPPAPSQRPASPRRAVPSNEKGDSHSFLSGAELPSWLRVPEPAAPTDPGQGQTLDWLRRLGGPEQEEELPAAIATATVPQRPVYRRSPEQLAAITLLQQISRTPYPEPTAPATAAPLTRWQRIGLERVLYALLALALLLALLVPTLTGPLQTTAPTAQGAAQLGELIDTLGPDDVALVAYEWGAQRSGELRPLEAAIMSRLISKQVKLILVSTDLQGTLLSFDLVGPLRAAGYNTENGVSFGGRDYVLLGYRPGGELALRSLAQNLREELRSDFDGQDATQGLVANNPDGTPRFNGIQDLSMILVLADQPQDVQAWMEQVRPAATNVPIAFVLPQQAQPQAQPFLRLPNVYHVAGKQGALALTAGDPALVAQASGQLWFAVTVFLLLLAGGAIVTAVIRGRTARGGAA